MNIFGRGASAVSPADGRTMRTPSGGGATTGFLKTSEARGARAVSFVGAAGVVTGSTFGA
jgi:hypothetical protein